MSQWRVIPLETHNAFMNMALDETAAESIRNGQQLPTIRFYRWQPSAVSIGYFQSLADEVDIEVCKEAGVDVVRRRTGGGAVYHDYEGEITYSIIAPETYFPKGIIDSYHIICGWIVDALAQLGIKTEFKPINDIVMAEGLVGDDGVVLGGRKISGNAQTRRQGILLQHGTILYTVDVRKMFSLLKVGKEKIADKLIQAVEDRVTSVKKLKPELGLEELYEALLQGFTSGKDWKFGEWSVEELMRARTLAEERYGTKDWNFER